MCGLYGVAYSNSKAIPPNLLLKSLKTIGLLSQSRGKDSSGVLTVKKNELKIYKGPVSVNKLLKDKRVKKDLRACFSLKKSCSVGHARLVTNGSQLDLNNNQPVQVGGIIGIHNGIVTNIDKLKGNNTVNHNIDLLYQFNLINYPLI